MYVRIKILFPVFYDELLMNLLAHLLNRSGSQEPFESQESSGDRYSAATP